MVEKNIVVYTAVFDDYDILMQPKHAPDSVDFVCFTDDPDTAHGVWEPHLIDGSKSPRHQTARAKMLPHEYFSEYEYSLWVDGNLWIVGDVTQLIDEAGSGIVTFDHPRRDCLYQEAEVCVKKGLADADVVAKQMERYRQKGFPESYGLSDVAMLVRQHNDPCVKDIMETWWDEFQRGSTRTQLCFEYSLWKHGFEPERRIMDFGDSDYFCAFSHKPSGLSGQIAKVRLRALEKAERTPYFLIYSLTSIPLYASRAHQVAREEGVSSLVRRSFQKLYTFMPF